MSRRTRTAAVLLSSAALLGAGAPSGAVGHDNDRHHARHHHRDGLRSLARELGVTKQQLRTALKAVKEQQRSAAKPASFKTLLAQELGVTREQVKAAFHQARASGADSRDEFKAAFATALGVDAARLDAAFKSAREAQKAAWKARRDAFVAALAAQLGVPTEKVEAAFSRKHRRHR